MKNKYQLSTISNTPVLNGCKDKLLILSPTVKNRIEREANIDDFETVNNKCLGTGGYGEVWLKKHKETNKVYAVKIMNKEKIIKNKQIDQINKEVEIMYQLYHPHIIRLYNHFEDEDNFYLIIEYAPKGNLFSEIKKNGAMSSKTAAQYMREIISAIKYLHSKKPPIIHRDIKPENVLLTSDMRCKLADFGCSNFCQGDKDRETFLGTPEYVAPEMIKKCGHNESVDIWAVGVLLFELLTRRTPFHGINDRNVLLKSMKNQKINWPSDLDPVAKDLISKILKENPEERLSLDEILSHTWFKINPPIKPILKEYEYNEQEKLLVHIIHSIPKKSNKNDTSQSNISCSENEEISNSGTKKKKEDDFDLNSISKEIEIEDKTKSNLEVKESKKIKVDKIKFDKAMKDYSIYKEELKKKNNLIKELQIKLENCEKNISKKEEKSTDKKDNEIIEKLNKKKKDLESLKIEMEELLKENSDIKSENENIKEKISKIDEENKELKKKLNDKKNKKEIEIENLKKKIKIFKNSEDTSNIYDIDKMIITTNSQLEDLSMFTKNKFDNLSNKILNEKKFKEEYSLFADEKAEILIEKFKDKQDKLLREEENSFINLINVLKEKNNENKKELENYESTIEQLKKEKDKDKEVANKLEEENRNIQIYLDEKSIAEDKYNYIKNLAESNEEKIKQYSATRDIYKNAFIDAENYFNSQVKNGKTLKELINFNYNFIDSK